MTCPSCHTLDTEPMDNGMSYCPACNHAWTPEQPPRMVDVEPRRRRDVD